MVWRVEKKGRISFLVGTAHFFPFSLKRDLEKVIRRCEDILFEGPLNQESMDRIAQYGRQGEDTPSLLDALGPAVKREINQQLSRGFNPHGSVESSLQILLPKNSDYLEAYTRGVRPWMAFFTIWSNYLDWKYSIDMEAFHIAQKLGKRIHFLEIIEEQLEALDGIPFEGIVEFVNHFERWKSYKEQFLNYFFEGDLDKLMSRTTRFPTRCESILGNRDISFFQRLKTFFEKGQAIAFLGISHIPTIKKMFLDEGYSVTQEKV